MSVIKYCDDYVDAVHEKFPDLSRQEVKKMITYGFKMMNIIHRNGMDTLHKCDYMTAYVGKLFNDGLIYYHYWRLKFKKKLRYMYKKKTPVYDGYYYFGMTEKEFQYWNSQKPPHGGRRLNFHYPYIYAYKVKEEAFLDRGRKYFFRLSFPNDVGWKLYKEDWTTRRAQYFAYRNENNEIIYIEDGKRRSDR